MQSKQKLFSFSYILPTISLSSAHHLHTADTQFPVWHTKNPHIFFSFISHSFIQLFSAAAGLVENAQQLGKGEKLKMLKKKIKFNPLFIPYTFS